MDSSKPETMTPRPEQHCQTCRYHRDGECHRKSPTGWLIDGARYPRAQWPIVGTLDWCGEWAPKPEERG